MTHACQDKFNLLKALVLKINKLTLENIPLKQRSITKTLTFSWSKKTEVNMRFYTGMNTIVLFSKIFKLIQPFSSAIGFGRGQRMQKHLAKSGIENIVLLKN